MEVEEKQKKRPLDLDWERLLDSKNSDDDRPPALVVVATTASGTDAAEQRLHREHSSMSAEPQSPQQLQQSQRDGLELMSDDDLNDSLHRQILNLENLGPKLPDKGAKLRANIKRLEDEKERRRLLRLRQDTDGCEVLKMENSSSVGGSNGLRQEIPSSKGHSLSSFASHFCRKLEENSECRTVNAFDQELSVLGRCDRRKTKLNGQSSKRQRARTRLSMKQLTSHHPHNPPDNRKYIHLNSGEKGKTSSVCSLSGIKENLACCFTNTGDVSEVLPFNYSRPQKAQTVVLVDEEEPQFLEAAQEVDKVSKSMKETTIYYPSRDDLESVEICSSDIACLAPEAYLSSTIMNFYIRYLQQPTTPTVKVRGDYHFFNTYFYKKLKEAVSHKSNKETFFIKFRRWWKGVNIFQKAYILLPIHEDLHWSLVIICIPDKDDESGPVILHLDSLGLHCSKSIFGNIRSYLSEEWNYLNQEVAPPDVPIADGVWKHLPHRINERKIMVPQQKNEYDCGLFVLFFMERFIEEAPERLKKKDLAMFSKQWFKPEEASNLRAKILKLLTQEFQSARANNCISESLCSPSGFTPAESIELQNDS